MWVPERPQVYKEYGFWVASLKHYGWTEWADFDNWERAMEHALWLGLTNGVWKL